MKVTIHPSRLSGQLDAPSSKSSMQRALAAALLHKGNTKIINPGHSNDDLAALSVIRQLGAIVSNENEHLNISSNGVQPISNAVSCGESGLAIRMFTPIAALADKPIHIQAEGSLRSRPMELYDEVFPLLDVQVMMQDGKPPITVRGPLHPSNITIDGLLSSQFLTGLLFAYSAAGASDVTITVKDLKSRPYIDMTIEVMKHFGMKIPVNDHYRSFYFSREDLPFSIDDISYEVEADWSGAAFLLVAAAISGPLLIRGLNLSSAQADRKIIDVLMQANAGIAFEAKGIRIQPAPMKGFQFDATECPDLFPPLVALAAYCNGISQIKGVSRLRHKESDRGKTLQLEFKKLGVQVDVDDDTMTVHGGGSINAAEVFSHHDHRIAMALAVAGLRSTGATIIRDADAVKKSYPSFFEDLKKAGATLSLFHIPSHE